MCPGLALGIRASEVVLEEIGHHSQGNLVAVVETDMCAVDAIQFLTGCTLGKGNLVHLDHGKNAYTFFRRSDGRAIRLATNRDAFDSADSDWVPLATMVTSGVATEEVKERFADLMRERSQRIMGMPTEALYTVREIDGQPPRPARVFDSVTCASCEEQVMETRIRRLDGRFLCVPCFDQAMAGSVSVGTPPVRGPG